MPVGLVPVRYALTGPLTLAGTSTASKMIAFLALSRIRNPECGER